MSLILEKRVLFGEDVITSEKKGIFLGIFTEKGSFSGANKRGVFAPVIGVFF